MFASAKQPESAPPRSVAIFLPNWIGDVVMATPALQALRQHFAAPTRLIGVMRPYVSKVLDGSHYLDEHLYFDRRSKNAAHLPGAVTRSLREKQVDVAILLTNSFYSGWIAWRSGARRRIGYARNLRGMLLTQAPPEERLGWKWKPKSAVDSYLQLARAAGCQPSLPPQLQLGTLPADEAGAEQAWRQLGLTGRRVVLLNTGSANAPARLWPDEYLRELCARLATQPQVSVLLLCGPVERERVAALAKAVSHPHVHSMAEQDLSLGVSKAVIRRGDVMVTTDSGPRHIAAAFQIPTVALFGPIAPAWTTNYNADETMLVRDLPCRPCGQKTCPLVHHRCLRDITVEDVYQATLRHLAKRTQRQAA